VGHHPHKILVGWAIMHLALPIIGLYVRFLRKISKIGAIIMSDFKATMHQIRFPLGLLTRLRTGSLQRSPKRPSCTYF